jgi:hypothetical protein
MPTTTVSPTLKWDVLVTNRQGLTRDLPPGKEKWMWVPTSATLIYGERDAVLVDALLTVEQAHAAVEWIAASGKNLTTIYITHGHGDHFFGIGALLDRFPNAKAVATPHVLKVMRRQMSPEFVASFWNARYPGQIPEHLERLDREVLAQLGLSMEDARHQADAFVRIPENAEAIFRAAVERHGVPVADILQVWLDVAHHPARGKDQAKIIAQKALSQLLDEKDA